MTANGPSGRIVVPGRAVLCSDSDSGELLSPSGTVVAVPEDDVELAPKKGVDVCVCAACSPGAVADACSIPWLGSEAVMLCVMDTACSGRGAAVLNDGAGADAVAAAS